MKKTERKNAEPFKPLVNRSARANAKTLIRMTETQTNATVIPKACQKVDPFPKASTKFETPLKLKSLMVLYFVKEKKTPIKNGTRNAPIKQIRRGARKIGA